MNRVPLIAMILGAALPVEAAERFHCTANVSCTFEWGCRGGDIPWVLEAWKEGDVWLVTDTPEGGVPVVFVETGQITLTHGAIFLQRDWRDGGRQGVDMLTILKDRRMIKSWHSNEPVDDYVEHTILGECIEEAG